MNQDKNREVTIAEARRAREERQNQKKKQNAAIVIQVFYCVNYWLQCGVHLESFETKNWSSKSDQKVEVSITIE